VPVTPKNFLDLSKDLLTDEASEIELRCSIKNAYYGAYHITHSVLTSPVPEYKGMGAHKGFITYLQEDAFRHEGHIEKSNLRRLAIMLGQLKIQRHKADYQLSITMEFETAKLQQRTANSIFELCDDI
jgi:uncharacterized protein (UPF0332 family)